ncbi:Uma2 family endonuclease [Longimicrobium sp.]|jgi:Uma2 family endonuclease|uniref:Uma2 family endonuclease n=1 Tax=Longimicrobium sp. TaxID=2029185 RepID=UPI002ED7E045
MSTQPAVRGWTYEEFANLPDDGNRYEVIAGELYVTPSPTSIHQRVVARLTAMLEVFTQEHGLGTLFGAPYDVIFGEGDYLEPDLLFVRREREEIVKDHAMVGAPDLVVEVLSPSTSRRDRGLKRERYAAYGVPEYWIIDTDLVQVDVYRLSGGDLRRTEVATDFLRWRPAPGGPELVIDVPHLMRAPTDYSRPRTAN